MECIIIGIGLLVGAYTATVYYVARERGFWKGYFHRINEELEAYDGVKRNP